MTTDTETRSALYAVHCLRMKEHWGEKTDLSRFPWHQTDADWRQVPHGHPADSNVGMAQFHLSLARRIRDEGLLG